MERDDRKYRKMLEEADEYVVNSSVWRTWDLICLNSI